MNYSGSNVKLKIYLFDYYNSNDYVFYSPNLNTDQDIIYCDNQDYLFEFESLSLGMWIMSFTLTEILYNFTNLNSFILHIMYDSNSSLGYKYDVEYFDVANTSTNTTSYCNYLNVPTGYLDLIGDDLNFGVSPDARYLVNNSLDPQYSAIAYQETEADIPIGNGNMLWSSYRGSATFVDETTVIGCAHLFFLGASKSSLATSVKCYPGANSYQNPTNWHSNYGEYTATDVYLPMAYSIVIDNLKVQYDWSIVLTECTAQGIYSHSYMGLLSPSIGTYSVHSVGYPSLYYDNSGTNYYEYSLWTSYPLTNSVSVNSGNVIESEDIIISEGNSGGPLYRYIEVFYNGVYSGYLRLIGICSRFHPDSKGTRISYFCKITPRIINIYLEVI